MHISFWQVSLLRDNLCLSIIEIGIIPSKLSRRNLTTALDANPEGEEQHTTKDENESNGVPVPPKNLEHRLCATKRQETCAVGARCIAPTGNRTKCKS